MRAAIDESVDDFSTIQQPHNKLKLFHLSSETTVSSAHTRDCNRSNLMNVFQVFITSLNLTWIKNEFNYIFALITLKCIIGEVFALCALCMCVCVCARSALTHHMTNAFPGSTSFPSSLCFLIL